MRVGLMAIRDERCKNLRPVSGGHGAMKNSCWFLFDFNWSRLLSTQYTSTTGSETRTHRHQLLNFTPWSLRVKATTRGCSPTFVELVVVLKFSIYGHSLTTICQTTRKQWEFSFAPTLNMSQTCPIVRTFSVQPPPNEFSVWYHTHWVTIYRAKYCRIE